MILHHYTGVPVERLAFDAAKAVGNYAYSKPVGVWLSDDSDFDILEFTRTWGSPAYPEEVAERMGFNDTVIQWKALRESWAGLMITPYCWELRLDRRTRWYYGWDCASACVWDLSVLGPPVLDPLPQLEAPAPLQITYQEETT